MKKSNRSRKTTSTRITPEVRAQLDEAAASSGRSLAQEIEIRLERSLAETRRLRDINARLLGKQEEEALFGPLPSASQIEANEINEPLS
jgi:predicted DNA-binding protein